MLTQEKRSFRGNLGSSLDANWDKSMGNKDKTFFSIDCTAIFENRLEGSWKCYIRSRFFKSNECIEIECQWYPQAQNKWKTAKESWMVESGQRETETSERGVHQPKTCPVTCQAAHLLSLFYLSATLTLTAPRYSPFTLFLLKSVHPPSLPWFFFSWPFLTFFSLLLQLPDSSFQDTGSQC